MKSAVRYKPGQLGMAKDFPGDDTGWEAWKAWKGDAKKGLLGFAKRISGPLDRWLATRLVRTFPAVIALYEKVKARHRAVDQVDLLLSLRNLLVRDLDVRREMQGLFDHVFVDEFQDTDPLQAEIILFLCEKEPVAAILEGRRPRAREAHARRRPEAVDLPVPPRRHHSLRVGAPDGDEGAAPSRPAHGQLPLAARPAHPPQRALRRDPRKASAGSARLRRGERIGREPPARRRPGRDS